MTHAIEQELKHLRELFLAAMEANLRVLDATMKAHGRPPSLRAEILADTRAHELGRMRTMLAECEAALLREGQMVQ